MSSLKAKGMKKEPPADNSAGGEDMQTSEIKLGEVTYEVRRVFNGTRPARDLVVDRLAEQFSQNLSFDDDHTKGI